SCRTGECGNSKIDPTEICDGDVGVDAAAGERCSDDCKQIWVCGNAVPDPGEQCDDGNTNPADGCDACVQTTWSATAVIGGNANATHVGLSFVTSVALDQNGDAFIADTYGNRVWR